MFLRDYALTGEREYFAEYFACFLRAGNDSERAAEMERLTPRTYGWFATLEEPLGMHHKSIRKEGLRPKSGLLTKWEFSTAEDGRQARKKTPLASIQTLYHSLEV